jgi:signal transduction histidine kinase
VRATFNLPDEDPCLTDRQGEALFRIAQEAIANIVQHAGASQATIALKSENGHLYLLVADDGCGFDPAEIGQQRLGLLGMAERAALIQGGFDLDTAPGRGTRVRVRLSTRANQEGQDG